MSTPYLYLGLDFAKEKFNYQGAEFRGSLPNNPAGHRRFLARIPAGAHLVCESTGPYHRALVLAAHAAGVVLSVVNPRQVRDFASGLGRRAKTEPLDAQSLYDFSRLAHPKADSVPSATQLALQELVVARQQAVLERSTLMVQRAGQSLPLVKARHQARIALLTKGMSSIRSSSVREFDIAPIFSELANEDYNRTVELARMFEREAPRASATIAIARSILEEKKKP